MPNSMRLVAATAVVVVVGVVGFNLLPRSPGVGGVSSPPTLPPCAAAPTPSQSPAASPIDTTTWTPYTSTSYGFSICHPAAWTVRPATGVWSFPADATLYEKSPAERFAAADSSIAVSAWSVAVAPGTSLDAWLQAYCPVAESNSCTAIQGLSVAASMDGHAGLIVKFTDDTQAFFLVGNRIYVVGCWRPESDPTVASYGGAVRLLEAYLSTMHLLPGGPAPASTTAPPVFSSAAPS